MIRIGREIQCLPYAGFFFLYIGPMIRIGREIQCLPYAGFFIKSVMLPILLFINCGLVLDLEIILPTIVVTCTLYF